MTTDARGSATSTAPIVKEVIVPLSRERAFALFTERIASWWPLATHSLAGEKATSCRFEPHVGGRLLETAADGTEHVWGTLLEWNPPAKLAMTWHPGRAADSAQHVVVTLTSEGGATRLRLVHSGWQKLAAIAPRQHADYDSGWDYVLGLYVRVAGRALP